MGLTEVLRVICHRKLFEYSSLTSSRQIPSVWAGVFLEVLESGQDEQRNLNNVSFSSCH